MNSIVIFFVTNLLLMSSPSLSDGESWIGVGGTNSIAHKNIVVESFTNTNLLSSLIRNSKQTNDYFIVGINENMDNDNSTIFLSKKSIMATQNVIWAESIGVRKPRDLESWFWGNLEMKIKDFNTQSIASFDIYNRKKCSSLQWDDSNFIFIAEYANIGVYEYDTIGSHEVVIEEAYLHNVTEEGLFDLDVYTEGEYYDCNSSYPKRCNYNFSLTQW